MSSPPGERVRTSNRLAAKSCLRQGLCPAIFPKLDILLNNLSYVGILASGFMAVMLMRRRPIMMAKAKAKINLEGQQLLFLRGNQM